MSMSTMMYAAMPVLLPHPLAVEAAFAPRNHFVVIDVVRHFAAPRGQHRLRRPANAGTELAARVRAHRWDHVLTLVASDPGLQVMCLRSAPDMVGGERGCPSLRHVRHLLAAD